MRASVSWREAACSMAVKTWKGLLDSKARTWAAGNSRKRGDSGVKPWSLLRRIQAGSAVVSGGR